MTFSFPGGQCDSIILFVMMLGYCSISRKYYTKNHKSSWVTVRACTTFFFGPVFFSFFAGKIGPGLEYSVPIAVLCACVSLYCDFFSVRPFFRVKFVFLWCKLAPFSICLSSSSCRCVKVVRSFLIGP